MSLAIMKALLLPQTDRNCSFCEVRDGRGFRVASQKTQSRPRIKTSYLTINIQPSRNNVSRPANQTFTSSSCFAVSIRTLVAGHSASSVAATIVPIFTPELPWATWDRCSLSCRFIARASLVRRSKVVAGGSGALRGLAGMATSTFPPEYPDPSAAPLRPLDALCNSAE